MMASPVSFETLLRDYNLAVLEKHHGTIYGLWSNLRLAYVNPAWYRFAAENGGEPAISTRWKLGTLILDALPQFLRAYYETAYRKCLDAEEPWEHQYECSSKDLYRHFHQIVYPLENSGLLVVNSLIVEHSHDPAERHPQNPEESAYRDIHGLIHQCAHCRRVQNLLTKEQWDWVPEWVERVPSVTSHTFCPTCFGYYYPVN
jgi:hypothetical protein